MKRSKHLYSLVATMTMATMMTITLSCRHGGGVSENTSASDSILAEQADSTVRVTAMGGNSDRAMLLIDSFLNVRQISPVRANMLKFVVHVYKNEAMEGYKFLEELCDRCSKTGEDPAIYAASAIQLASYYQINAKLEEALRVALPAITMVENSPRVAADRKGALFNIIGNCQMLLKQYDDADNNFEKCFQYYQIHQKETESPADTRIMVMGLTNTTAIRRNAWHV